MSEGEAAPLGFWATVGLLLSNARKRAAGRRAYQMKLWRHRTGRKGWSIYQTPWGLILSIVVALLIHLLAAWIVTGVVAGGERVDAEKAGLIAVNDWFIADVHRLLPQNEPGWVLNHHDRLWLEFYFRQESGYLVE